MSTKENQQGRILPREDFNLEKFKFTKDGVSVKHHLGGTDPQTQSNDCDWRPHPDLITKVDKLQLYMATRLGLLTGWDFAREHLKKNPNYLKKAMDGHKATVAICNVNGITLVGEGETAGVMITGSIKTPKNGSTGLAVPKIAFGKSDLGYETDVQEICEEIADEVYNYLILKKKEQANIEDQAEGFDNAGGVQTSLLEEEKPQTTFEKFQELNNKTDDEDSSNQNSDEEE